MNKIIIELYIPAAMKSFDIFVPEKSTVGEIMYLIRQMLPELSEGLFEASDSTVLCERATGNMYPPELTVEQAGIKEGTEVFVI